MFPDPETYSENIVKIVQMSSDVQQEFYEAMRIHFVWKKTTIQQLFSSLSQSAAVIESTMMYVHAFYCS